MVSRLGSVCSLNCLAESLDSMSGPFKLSSLGRICGSTHSNEMVVMDRVKRKNSVRRMSIIEDGELAEVLYLIPKQSMMDQLPFLNPNDYILCEKLASIPAEMSGNREFNCVHGCYLNVWSLTLCNVAVKLRWMWHVFTDFHQGKTALQHSPKQLEKMGNCFEKLREVNLKKCKMALYSLTCEIQVLIWKGCTSFGPLKNLSDNFIWFFFSVFFFYISKQVPIYLSCSGGFCHVVLPWSFRDA